MTASDATGSGDITVLLRAWSRGADQAALDRLTAIVYEQLRRLARQYLRKERAGHVLESRALVHEAYIRLVDAADVDWKDRSHFFAVAALTMRRILIDAARARAAAKRGGGNQRLDHSSPIDFDAMPARSDNAAELCALDDALDSLADIDPRRAKVIELRFFGGLSVEETAEILDISPQSVMRDWRLARAWLARELRRH